ncbi:MAG: hypothetical protein LQ340_002293 [Diploschistes diacapsis]|nr:MAG: hypothetical protein LQ340_002293 [Diploschistes diacapsis]
MDPRRPQPPAPEHTLEIFADPASIKTVVQGVLHTIFFHRYFPTIRPSTQDILHLTLPYVADPDLESLIDSRVYQLTRQLSSITTPNNSVRGQIGVQFFEKRRRRKSQSSGVTGGVAGVGMAWFGRGGGGAGAGVEEEVCWEVWRVEVTLAVARTQEAVQGSANERRATAEQRKVMRAMETSLQKTALKIVAIANGNKEQIPPITTSETNPFPYQITLNPRLKNTG